ncbi:MAG: TolC family protein [Polyangiales bacterium]
MTLALAASLSVGGCASAEVAAQIDRLAASTLRMERPTNPAPPAAVTRDAAVEFALDRDPTRRAALHRARAALHDAEAARALPAPQVGVQVWRVPFDEPWNWGRASMLMLELRQGFTPLGAREGRSRAALFEAQGALAELSSRERALAKSVALAHAEWVDGALHHSLHHAHLGVVGGMLEIVRARFAAGGANLGGVTRVEAEQARVHRALVRYEARRDRAARALEALLRLDEGSLPAEPPAEALVVEDVDVELPALLTAALGQRPELRARAAAEAAASARHQAARAEATVPRVEVGASVMGDPGVGVGYGLNAMMSLPWLSSAGAAAARAAGERLLAAREDTAGVEATIRGEVATAHTRLAGARRELAVMHGQALPAARRAVMAARSAYSVGGETLLGWIDAERVLLDLEMDDAELRAELLRAVAELEWAVGAPLPRHPLVLAPITGASE